MTLRTLFVHDITIVRPADVIDRYGNLIKDWPNATRSVVRGRIAQRHRDEDRDGRELQLTQFLCYLPPDTDVTAFDRIEWDGLTLEVQFRPHRAFGKRLEHHIELHLEAIEG